MFEYSLSLSYVYVAYSSLIHYTTSEAVKLKVRLFDYKKKNFSAI